MVNGSINTSHARDDGSTLSNRRKNKGIHKKMKSLILMSYKQPNENPAKFRWGIVEGHRDTKRFPLCRETLRSYYRHDDPIFLRTRNITFVRTRDGVKQFYRERTNWKITIPFVGSLFSRLLPA